MMTADSAADQPASSAVQRNVLIVAILATFVAFLDGTVVNVALPAIVDDLGGGLALQQWVVDGYLITLGALMLLAGSLSDQFGRIRILRIGLIGFGVTSVLCAVAPTGGILIAARILQGLTGALLVPSALALIISSFAGAAQSKAIGTWTAWSGTAAIVGPLVGGLLVDTLSWRGVFGINVLPILFTLWFLRRLEEPARHHTSVPLDWVGAATGAIGLGGTVYALIEEQKYGWTHPAVAIPLIVGLISLAAFLVTERRSSHPMMPLALFRVRNFWVGNIATVGIYGALSLGSFAITLFLQQSAGFAATQAGLILLPTTLVMLALSSWFGALAGRLGPRLFMAVGPIVAGVGFLLMTTVELPLNLWVQLIPGVLLFGLGLSMTVAPLTSAILGGIESERAGIGSAINNAVARVASLLGVAFAAVVTVGTVDLAGFHRAMIATAVLLIVSGAVSALGISNASVKDRPDAGRAPSTA